MMGKSMSAIRKSISLVVTQNCNLSCSYCYEGYKTKKIMPYNIAIDIVERYLSNSSDEYDECAIEFFGGEPFLNFVLVKQVCEYVWNRKWTKPYLFYATTNGTLIHGDIQNWLYKNKHRFYVTLSLDGNQHMHDVNRSVSFSKIDLDFFTKTWENLPVKMTISKETLPYLAAGVIYLHSLGFEINNNFAYGIDWTDTENLGILQTELEKLIEFYLSHPEIEPCSLLDMKIEYQSHLAKKWCGVGTHMVVFDVDGEDYPCHAFLPMSIGSEKASLAKNIDFTVNGNLVIDKCQGCLLHSICPTCYGSNYSKYGNVALRDDDLCKLTKIRALACSKLQAKKILENNDSYNLEARDYLTIKSALAIQKQLGIR